MLTFNLKKEWFEKIARGEKRVEYREVKPYWTKRLGNAMPITPFIYVKNNSFPNLNMQCVFVLGYTKKKLHATISKIEIVDGKDTDLHIDKPVYAIHFELDKN